VADITASEVYNFINETQYRQYVRDALQSLEDGLSSMSQMGNDTLLTSIMSRSLETGRNIPISTPRDIVKHKITTATATPYAQLASDQFVVVNTGIASAVNLLTAVGRTGRQLVVKGVGATTVTINTAGAETIDGAATAFLPAWGSTTIVSDGANWITI